MSQQLITVMENNLLFPFILNRLCRQLQSPIEELFIIEYHLKRFAHKSKWIFTIVIRALANLRRDSPKFLSRCHKCRSCETRYGFIPKNGKIGQSKYRARDVTSPKLNSTFSFVLLSRNIRCSRKSPFKTTAGILTWIYEKQLCVTMSSRHFDG